MAHFQKLRCEPLCRVVAQVTAVERGRLSAPGSRVSSTAKNNHQGEHAGCLASHCSNASSPASYINHKRENRKLPSQPSANICALSVSNICLLEQSLSLFWRSFLSGGVIDFTPHHRHCLSESKQANNVNSAAASQTSTNLSRDTPLTLIEAAIIKTFSKPSRSSLPFERAYYIPLYQIESGATIRPLDSTISKSQPEAIRKHNQQAGRKQTEELFLPRRTAE